MIRPYLSSSPSRLLRFSRVDSVGSRPLLGITAIVFAILVTVQPSLATTSDKQTDGSEPPQSQSVSDRVMLAGRMDHRPAEELRRENTLVIDLRFEDEAGVKEEQDRLANASVEYVHFPTGRNVPSVEQVRHFEKILNNNTERPILIHCSSGNRAGLLWATHLIEQGMDAEDAVKQVQSIANREPIRSAIRGYRAGAEQ